MSGLLCLLYIADFMWQDDKVVGHPSHAFNMSHLVHINVDNSLNDK